MYGKRMNGKVFSVGVVGASGFTGAELLRLIHGHSQLQLAVATGDSKAGSLVSDLYPHLRKAYEGLQFATFDPESLDGLDLVFCGLPHGVSMSVIPQIRGKVGHIIDLGSDFRLHDAGLYPQWYGAEHTCPELLADFVYGVPELFRQDLLGAELIAATGCNALTAVLTLAPLLASNLIEPEGIVANIITGVSGAGRPPKPNTTFCAVDENATAYGLLGHRHTPEIEQALTDATGLAPSVLFTPHLIPMNRGILATCYGRATAKAVGQVTTESVVETMRDFYQDEPFIVVDETSPETKSTLGSNTVHLTARIDPRTGFILGIGALDNLMKGASGMAVQNANLALGLKETLGLANIGLYP